MSNGEFRQVTLAGGHTVEFSITDQIARNNKRLDRFATEGLPPGMFAPSRRLSADRDVYPKTDSYQFQEFAGVVFELGGYSDITMVDPYTLRRLWVGEVLELDEIGSPLYLFNGIRKVLDVAEAVGFFAGEQ